MNTSREREIVEAIANQLLPKVCHKHVYRTEHQRSMQVVDDGEYVYVSWTFFNDERVRLKARVIREDPFAYLGIRLEPLHEDYEAWQADAIMRCEAGEDIWPRPKQEPLFGAGPVQGAFNPALQANAQLQAQQLGALSSGALQSSSSQQGALSGLANALGINPGSILRKK